MSFSSSSSSSGEYSAEAAALAFQPPRNASSSTASSSASTRTTPPAVVSIIISRSASSMAVSDPYYSQRAQVVVWASRQVLMVEEEEEAIVTPLPTDHNQNAGSTMGQKKGRPMTSATTTTKTTRTTTTSSSRIMKHQLTYYSFWDHPRQNFLHTDALLQQLAPIAVVNVSSPDLVVAAESSSSSSSTSSPAAMAATKLMDSLIQMLENNKADYAVLPYQTSTTALVADSATAESDYPPAPEMLVQYHTTMSTSLSWNAVHGILQQQQQPSGTTSRVESITSDAPDPDGTSVPAEEAGPWTEASLRVAGDVQLAPHTPVGKALLFFLQVTGIHQTLSSTSLSAPATAMMVEITAGHIHRPSYLYMDQVARQAIHLWPPAGGIGDAHYVGGTATNNSLAGLLRQPCCTPMAKRLLESWLRQPLVDLAAIMQRQDAVAYLVQNAVGRNALRQDGLRSLGQQDMMKLILILSDHVDQPGVAPQEGGAGSGDGSTHPSTRGGNNSSTTTSTNTRRALHCLYELYLIATQKIPLLVEQMSTLMITAPPTTTTSTARATITTQETTTSQSRTTTHGGRGPDTSNIGTASSRVAPGPGATSSSKSPNDVPLLLDSFEALQRIEQQLGPLAELVTAVLDLDAAPRELVVQPGYRPELKQIWDEMEALQEQIQRCHEEMNDTWVQASGCVANASGNMVVRLERINDSGSGGEYQFRLPNTNDSKILQNQLGSKVHVHKILKNGVYFSTPALRQLATQQQDLRSEYDKYSRQVVLDAMKVAATYQPLLEQASDCVALLDVLAALAHVAAYNPFGYCRPVLTDSDEDGAGIELVAARHPCLELQERVDFIPNNYKLVLGQSSFLLVTGPNMGGKSTYIRAVGAIVALAQIGSFVPCASAKINICHHILARVGAGDLQERGISTFMAEMLESSSILRTATKRSLLIIDELGRGTSTFDGYGLARAISEYIVQRIGCITVFATHFHELTALEGQERQVQNCHVTATTGNQGLTFLYEVKPGPCLESFGIQVAEMANMPYEVIRDAKRKAEELENFEYCKRVRCEDSNNDADAARGVGGLSNRSDEAQQVGDHVAAEEAAAAVAWVNRFRRIPKSILVQEYDSMEEKQRALMRLLEV